MTRIRPAATALLSAVALTVAACSSSGVKTKSSGSTPPLSSTVRSASAPVSNGPVITINGFKFSGTLTVKPGAKITVKNEDSVAHTLTDKKTHKFDTGNIAGGGATATFTAPSVPGKYPFGCTYHPNMAGTLVVRA